MTIVYLENLGFKKISQHSNDEDVQAMLDEGYRVIRLDYQGNAKAVSPGINQDIISINDQLNKGSMCGFSSISPIRSYILMEGYRIRRDVSYYLDDPTIYNWPGSPYTESQGDSLYMDIIYPTSPTTPVPVLLSFSYSNSYATLSGGKLTDEHYHQRLYLGYTLSMFDDSVLEGAPAHGIAWAIADHPKYCDWGQGKPQGGNNKDYGSIETNPDAARKVKSAVRTLRTVGESLGLNGEIAIFGFSRGATAGSLAIGNLDVPEFQDASRGLYPDANDHVQAAILGPGVFDYTLLPQGRNEYKHATAVWGDLSTHCEDWERQGQGQARPAQCRHRPHQGFLQRPRRPQRSGKPPEDLRLPDLPPLRTRSPRNHRVQPFGSTSSLFFRPPGMQILLLQRLQNLRWPGRLHQVILCLFFTHTHFFFKKEIW